MSILDEDPKFKSCITHVCVYCSVIKNWLHLKSKYDLVNDVVESKDRVIKFINNFSSEKIKPYQTKKVITLNDYLEKYKDLHIKISQFYGDLTIETFKNNIEKMKLLIEHENKKGKLKNIVHYKVLNGFFSFDLKYDIYLLDKLIIKEFTKETYGFVLNKLLMNTNFNNFEIVAYFTARIMYSLNEYARHEGTYFNRDKYLVYGGGMLSYSDILSYKRVKGKIILLSAFTESYDSKLLAEFYACRNKSKILFKKKRKFSVIFIIKNNFKENWISNGIDIDKISVERKREILYQPFSFYYVRDIKIDLVNCTADIYLETIGKKEILEEEIKFGNEIVYNEKEKIMEVK